MADPIRQALGRLQEYAAAHPEHDTAELVAAALATLAADPPAPVPSLPLPARPSMPLLAPLNGWAACVDGNLVAVYSDQGGTPGHLLWSAEGGMKQEGQADG